ncbi:MAG: hypothetical protein ACOCXJ_00845 [Planctomycetota bacterium]
MACERSLAEEEAMATWLGERIEAMTTEFLDREFQHRASA